MVLASKPVASVMRLAARPVEELAEKLGMPVEKVRKVLKLAREPLSIETPVGDEEDVRLGDLIEDKNAIQPIDAAIQSNLRETTTRVLASVTPREVSFPKISSGLDSRRKVESSHARIDVRDPARARNVRRRLVQVAAST